MPPLDTTCPKCKHTGILIGEHTIALHALEGDKLSQDQAFKMGMTVCEKCGHVDLYSLKVFNQDKNSLVN